MSKEKQQKAKAAALRFDRDVDNAPKVTAVGKGYVAENILEKAIKHQIPIQSDPTLVELLSELNINETIPEELYQAVAEVFAYIYQIDQQSK
ncbi:EscU/YscU/HrcU family type III secretion system export apparatus switch protein [Gracilibacillus dipsosauri]|uniref:EscU/YscU/HrcU family type III secretion system export apparatus switch protein n=1 Tax=Gracilibacillus dipsosauri TaxID=178340 RepID=UPI0024099B8C